MSGHVLYARSFIKEDLSLAIYIIYICTYTNYKVAVVAAWEQKWQIKAEICLHLRSDCVPTLNERLYTYIRRYIMMTNIISGTAHAYIEVHHSDMQIGCTAKIGIIGRDSRRENMDIIIQALCCMFVCVISENRSRGGRWLPDSVIRLQLWCNLEGRKTRRRV